MARDRRSASKKNRPKTSAIQKRLRQLDMPLAISVDQFCHAHNISRDLFYDVLRKNQAPVCMMVGKRRLISFEASERWRKQREKLGAYR
jgi:hypothetical protein